MLCAFKSLGVAFFLNNLSAHQASFINLRLHCALHHFLCGPEYVCGFIHQLSVSG